MTSTEQALSPVPVLPARRGMASAVKAPLRHALVHSMGLPLAIDHTITAAMFVFTAAAVTHVAQIPWGWIAGLSLIGMVGLTWIFRSMCRHTPSTWLTLASTALAGTWLTWTAATTPWSLPALAALMGSAVALGVAYQFVRRSYNVKVFSEVKARAEGRAEVFHHLWEKILADAGVKDVTIDRLFNDGEWTRGEKTFPAGKMLRLHLGTAAPDFKGLVTYASQIEKIAASHVDHKVRAGSIQFRQPDEEANLVEMIIPTRDVLSELIPAPRWVGPRSIHDPLIIGRAVDGTDIGVELAKNSHGMVTGITDAGKSNVFNAHAFELTRCIDNVTWMICGPAKAPRGFKPWLRPWLKGVLHPVTGQPINPAIDWVAPSWQEAMYMLLDAYKAIGVRQRLGGIDDVEDKWIPTPDRPRITILMDESPDLLNCNDKMQAHDGQWYTFSELQVKIERLARSEAINLIFFIQRATNSMLGPEAGDIRSLISYRVGMRAGGYVELNATFNSDTNGIELSTLPNGAMFIERNGDVRPILAKSFRYEAGDIEWAAIHHASYAGQIDEATAAHLTYYRDRWTRPQQQEFFVSLSRGGPLPSQTVPTVQVEPSSIESLRNIERDLSDPDVAALWAALDDYGAQPDRAKSDAEVDAEVELLNEMLAVTPYDSLDSGAQALIELIGSTDLEFATEWLPAVDIRHAAIEHGIWPDLVESVVDQRITDAMAALGLTKDNGGKKRIPINGAKTTCYNAKMLREALHRYRR